MPILGPLPSSSHRGRLWTTLTPFLLTAVLTAPLAAQTAGLDCDPCPGAFFHSVFTCPVDVVIETGSGCEGFPNCQDPQVTGPAIEVLASGDGTFEARLVVDVKAPFNSHPDALRNGRLELEWWDGGTVESGNQDFCQHTTTDRVKSFVQATGLTCAEAPHAMGTFGLRAQTCGGPELSSCGHWVDLPGLSFTVTAEDLGCPTPPPSGCNGDGSCGLCPLPGVAVDGDGVADTLGGPGATLRYRSGGTGTAGLPGSEAWSTSLGRGWSHTYAERIVPDPDAGHVWLLTRFGTFREFTDGDGDGLYEQQAPSDEYRTLTFTSGIGWKLTDLEGTVERFDTTGRWTGSEDRNGNRTTASYNTDGELETVTFPDQRSESFTYGTDGKLTSITEVGVDGTTSRTWALTWTGEDLTRLDRPDGTSIELVYGDPDHPGMLTRKVLVGTQGGRRVLRAWAFDAAGRVEATWRGDVDRGGPDAVDLETIVYDDPSEPTVTTVTDPLGRETVYTFDRDPASSKPRLTSVDGGCPVCGASPVRQLDYSDPDNPLRVTAETDGKGHVTLFEYDAQGQMTSRTEAASTTEQRMTFWTYDPDYPALVASVERPSVDPDGGATMRRTDLVRDVSGNVTERIETGSEAGAGFTYSTVMSHAASGETTTVDPPGFGTDDTTTFTHDTTRGNLVVATRTDPLVGTTTFGYDPLNRRTTVTDPNGVTTETSYDALDRVTAIIRKGATAAEDLVTTHEYDELGDLLRTTLPRGNVIEYSYDAAGRLISIERKPDPDTSGERTLFTLDAAGNRVRQEHQRWDAATGSWVTESETGFVYSTRCHLDAITHPDGTERTFEHDCNGNLSRAWDEAHDPASDPPTQKFTYDALDRLIEVRRPWTGPGEATEAVTRYVYDEQDHLIEVTDAEGNTTSYVYSDRDLLTGETSPVSGVTDHAYNPHGELVETTDARGVTVRRTVDELDRVTFVDYPDDTLDTTYVYDDPAVAFSAGRLTAITRNAHSVEYRYDRFGRLTRDGALTFELDANGNRTGIAYPGGVRSLMSYDFADRPVTLDVDPGTGTPEPVVTGATYLPSGPLARLTLANGTSEERRFDHRYRPTAILLDAPTPHRFDYTTDPVGNVTEIRETIGCLADDLVLSGQTVSTSETFTSCAGIEAGDGFTVATGGDVTFRAGTRVALGDGFSVEEGGGFEAGIDPALAPEVVTRSYTYQDVHYFLTGADGPWGSLDWSYDRIGNRLSETRDGKTESYAYAVNAVGGNTPTLTEVTLETGGSRTYTHGAAGHLEQVAAGANVVDLGYDDAGRLAASTRSGEMASFRYDGRSFLERAEDPDAGAFVEPTYSSDGLLQALRRQPSATDPEERLTVFYLAGRPVAQLEQVDGADSWLYLTTDHLGTPLVATDGGGGEVWSGGFEPFGRDYREGMASGASESSVFLRLPGQWKDRTWGPSTFGSELYYNVYRWYHPRAGRYGQRDPLGLFGGPHLYRYSNQSPTTTFDRLGLATWTCTGVGGEIALLAGFSVNWGTCESDCSLGSRWVIDYNWRQLGFGLSLSGSVPVSGSLFTFDDGAPFADPANFRFTPTLCSSGVSAAVGIGIGASSTQFGQPGGSLGGGFEAGFGLGFFTGCGSFNPSNPRQECCTVGAPEGPPRLTPAGDPRIDSVPTIGSAP